MPDRLKLIALGAESSGKTRLLRRMVTGESEPPPPPTIAIDYSEFTTDNGLKFLIWDTSGAERFKSLTNSFIRNAHIALICVDLSQKINESSIKAYEKKIKDDARNAHIVLVGTKLDLPDAEENFKTLQAYAKESGFPVLATSVNQPDTVDALKAQLKAIIAPAAESNSFEIAANRLQASLQNVSYFKRRKILAKVEELKTVLNSTEKDDEAKKRAITDFVTQSRKILQDQYHPAVKAILTLAAFAFLGVLVGGVGFAIFGALTGLWAPAAFTAALMAAHAGAIAVVSIASAAAVVGGSVAAYSLFKTPAPIEVEKAAVETFRQAVAPGSA